ncbi:MAG: phosphodiester glycosidase family protein [Ktedonobacteraceae bacterium]|nr:phosphodiester glycosidase family protein [Ktedonobacteraceae bacterium]
MPAKHRLPVFFLLCFLASSLIACNLLSEVTVNGTPVVSSGSTPTMPGLDAPLNAWAQVAPGVEIRAEYWKSAGKNEDTVIITRLDLRQVHISIGYQPDKPLTMSEWMNQAQARVIINGGYFDKNNRPTGLLVSDGTVTGTSYQGFGGMLAVDSQNHVTLRSLRQQPYKASLDRLQQATQSSPMLMLDGKRTQFDSNAASQRRSVAAMDKQGRLLFIVSPAQSFSLDELADLLVASDLSLQSALNLDGGASTGLYVRGKDKKVSVDALTPLPIVIIVK